MPTNEEYLDWQALHHSNISLGAEEFYEEIDAALANQDVPAGDIERLERAFWEAVNRLIFQVLNMRLEDPKALDAFATKFLNPEMSQSEVAAFLREIGRPGWKNRARACEKLRKVLRKNPTLEHVIWFDPRGGYRKRPSLNEKLLKEYRCHLERNAEKPVKQRENLYGPDGLYQRLAVKYHVMGADNKPSGGAVQSRITRALKDEAERGGD